MNEFVMKIDRIPCPTDDDWHSARGGCVTASTAGALFPKAMGFHTPFNLYHVLKGSYTPEDISGKEAIMRGNLVEKLGVHIIEGSGMGFTDVFYNDGVDKVFYRNEEFMVGATPDFICKEADGKLAIIQMKSVYETIYREEWVQEDGSVKAPNWIHLQATIEAFMVSLHLGLDPMKDVNAYILPCVFTRGVEHPFIPVAMNEKSGILWSRFLQRSKAFHARVLANDEPPPDLNRDGETLDGLYNEKAGLVVDLRGDPQVIADMKKYNQLRDGEREFAKGKEAIKNKYKHLMKNATVAYVGDRRKITWSAETADGSRTMRIPKFAVDSITQPMANQDVDDEFATQQL